MQSTMHVYEVRPRKDRRGVDLISDALPFGRLWYDGPACGRSIQCCFLKCEDGPQAVPTTDATATGFGNQ